MKITDGAKQVLEDFLTKKGAEGIRISSVAGGGSIYQSESWKKANTNLLTDVESRDYISGFPVFKAFLCDVKKGKYSKL